MNGKIFDKPEFQKLADKYNKSIAQVVLRYDLQKGIVTIPKSSKEHRIMSNADLFDFEITESDMKLLDAMDRNFRTGPDPNNFEWSVVL